MPLLRLRHSVRAIVLDDQDRILLCRFALQSRVVWATPGGGIEPGYMSGYDGAIQDYFLVRTAAFQPNGALSRDQLAAENITDFRWWQLAEIANYQGPDLFGPRDLAGPLATLIKDGVPDQPLKLGL